VARTPGFAVVEHCPAGDEEPPHPERVAGADLVDGGQAFSEPAVDVGAAAHVVVARPEHPDGLGR